jgi:phosphohistidine phosphatase SixA
MAKKLQTAGYSPTAILHSPILRAKQTADILADFFKIRATEEQELGFEGNEQKLLQKIANRNGRQAETLFLVGHGPPLQNFISHLLGHHCPIIMETSSAVVLQFVRAVALGEGNYLHYLTP